LNRHFKAKIISNLSLNSKNSLLTIDPLEPVIAPEPGQFYMIEVCDSYDPLLKRPFSFFRKASEGIQFLYKVRGRGTMMMKGLRDGTVLNVLGPLGKGYPKPESDKTPLLIAGGIGIASVFPLIEASAKKAYVLYGARDKDGLLMLDELKGLTDELIISTDDGSIGERGTVADILNGFLAPHSSSVTHYSLYACGPKPMLEAISKVAFEKGVKGYISAEENMACGVGACLGCAIKVKSQKPNAFCYKMVCKDGPVFPMEEIVW